MAWTCVSFGAAAAATLPLYQPPAPWVKPIAIPEGKIDRDGAAAQVLLQNIQTHFAAEHDDYFVEQAVKIRAAQGLQEWGNVIIPWRPDTETLVFHKLNILRDGKVIDALAGHNKVTILRREQNLEMAMLDGSLTATIQPEGLQVGDVLDMAYTRQVHDPVMKGRSQDWTFLARPGVVERAYLRTIWPKTKPVRWHATEGLGEGKLEDTAEGRELVFDLATVEAPHPPRGAPVRFAYLAEVQLTDFADWAEVSTLSEPLYTKASTLAPNSPLRAEIAKIAAASADPKVRAALALKLVQDKVRYLFLGLNNGGYIPADADVTWTRRFGDCKAKTALLLALLKGLGIDAQPGLVNTKVGDGLSERLPTLTAFDHVAVRARIGGKSYWLDGTRLGDSDLDSLPTPNYHWMLPVQKAGAVLEKLQPDAYAEPHWESHLRLDATAGLDKPALAHAEHVFRGEEGVSVRQDMEAQGRADQERNMRNYWRKQLPWVEPSKVAFSVDDKHNPVLTMDGEATLNWSHDSDGRNFFVGDSGIGGQTNFKRDPGPGQDAPFSVDFPFFDKRTVTITLPDKGAGFVLINANPISTVVAGIDYHRTTRMDQGVVQIETTRRAVAQEFAVSETSAASTILRDWAQHSVGVRFDAAMAKAGADGVDCGSTTPAASIAGCTRIIAAGKLGAPQMAATYFNRGQAYFGQGDWDRAIADYTQAISIKPDMAEAFNSRGAAYGRKQLPEQAIKEYGEAIRLNGKIPLYWMNRGFAYASQNKIDAAISDFSQILSIDPNYAPALIARGLAYDVLRDPDHAIADFDRALKLDPTNAAVMVDRGRDYAGKNDWVHAMQDFDLAVRTRADYADGYAARGAAFSHDRQFERALEDDDAAIRLKPGAANFWLARGMVYVQLDNVQHAIADYDEAIRLDSHDATAFYERAVAYARTKDYEHAIQDYSDAIRLRFNYEPALRGRAAAFGQVGQWSRAITDYTAVLAIKPNDRLALVGRGAAYEALQNLDLAFADFDQAVKLNPGDAVALADRGSVYRRKGKADLALADFNAALKINPSLQQALNGRRLVDEPTAGAAPSRPSAQGSAAAQFPPLTRGFGGAAAGKTYLPGWLQPTTAKAFLDRGAVSAMGGENDKAIADFNEAIRLDPAMAAAYVARGQALAAKGDVALALRDFDSALRLSPNDPATLKMRCFHRAKAGQGLDLALADCDAAVKLAPAQPDMLEGRALVLFRQGQYQGAVADCEAAIRLNPRQAGCLYIRGAAKGRLNDAVQSGADIAAARAISFVIVATYAKMGVSPQGAAMASANR